MVVASCSDALALRAGTGITINLSGHPMTVAQHYFNYGYCANFIRVVVCS